MSTFDYDLGVVLSVNSFMMEYEPDKERGIRWIDNYVNQFKYFYSVDSNKLCIEVNILGYIIYDTCVAIETDEWNGDDNLWHNLTMELSDNHLVALRDDKIMFDLVNDSLRFVAHGGYVKLAAYNCQACYDDVTLMSMIPDQYVCGDANGDGNVNVSDAVSIINYVFVGGAAPDPLESGDCNCDSSVNVSDAVFIINYVFTGGNAPCDTNGDGQPDC